MTRARRARARPLVAVVVVAVALVFVVDRLAAALDAPVAGTASSSVTPPERARDLGAADVPASVGFTGPPRRAEDDPGAHRARRLWFAQGRWWGVFAGGASGSQRIWGLTGPDGPWVDTGVVVDERTFAPPTVVWAKDRLVVASSGPRAYRSHGLRISRYRWSTARGTWVRDPDFPVQVTDAGGPDTQVAVAADGRVWLARLDGTRIVMAHSDATNLSYTAFAPLPGGLAAADVGGFSLLVDGAGLRLVWRSASTDRLTIATGDGTTWTSVAHRVYGIGGLGTVEAAAAGAARPGALVVLATSTLPQRGSNDQDPSVVLATAAGREVDVAMVARAADHLVGPRLVVDQDAGEIHVVSAAGPADPEEQGFATPWSVTDKVARVVDPTFAIGQGSVLLRAPADSFASPSVPAAATDASGLLVVASGSDLPVWRTAQRGGPAPGLPPQPGANSDTLVHDTFDQRQPGAGAPAAWYPDGRAPLSAEVVAEGSGGRALALTNPDGGPAVAACRAVPRTTRGRVTVRADVRSEGRGTADARLLTVKGPKGPVASARLTRKGFLGYQGPNGRVDQGLVADATPLRVTIIVDRGRRTADLRIQRVGGPVLMDVRGRPLLTPLGEGPEEVCIAPPPGNAAARLVLTDLFVAPA